MKLIASVTIVTKDKKGNTWEVAPGQPFDIDDSEGQSLCDRGLAVKPAKDEQAPGDKQPAA